MGKAGRHWIFVLLLFLGCGVVLAAPAAIPTQTVKTNQETETAKQTSRKPAPVVVTSSNSRGSKKSDDRVTEYWSPIAGYKIKITDSLLVLFTAVLAIFTGLLALSTHLLWRATKKVARDGSTQAARQYEQMEKSLQQNLRSAEAMEVVARTAQRNSDLMEGNWRRQMRAYLTVNINSGFYQDRERDLKFCVMPTLLNSGVTPAHKMKYWATADILPFPLPPDFDFPVAPRPQPMEFVIGPHQSLVLNATVDRFVPDEEVTEIKTGLKRRVFIWGEITYEDVFKESHKTRFCHSLFWFGDGANEQVSGTYAEKFNEAT